MMNKYSPDNVDNILKVIYEQMHRYSYNKDYIMKKIEKFFLEGKTAFHYIIDVVNNKEENEKIIYEELVPFFVRRKEKTIRSYLNQFVNIGYIEKVDSEKETYKAKYKIPTNIKATDLFNKEKVNMFKRKTKLKKFLDD